MKQVVEGFLGHLVLRYHVAPQFLPHCLEIHITTSPNLHSEFVDIKPACCGRCVEVYFRADMGRRMYSHTPAAAIFRETFDDPARVFRIDFSMGNKLNIKMFSACRARLSAQSPWQPPHG